MIIGGDLHSGEEVFVDVQDQNKEQPLAIMGRASTKGKEMVKSA